MPQGAFPSWPRLKEVCERLFDANIPQVALKEILRRGRVPVTGHQVSDSEITSNRIEDWLAQAGFMVLQGYENTIVAVVRGELLTRSFNDVRINWATLADELEASGNELKPRVVETARVRRQWPRELLEAWIAQQYPEGLPSTATDKVIARKYRDVTGITISLRTVRRARGGQ